MSRVGDKEIAEHQLEAELRAAGVTVRGLGFDGKLHTYSEQGERVDLPPEAVAVIEAHTAQREKTVEEYAAEFRRPTTTAARKQQLRDIRLGLLPPETVPA